MDLDIGTLGLCSWSRRWFSLGFSWSTFEKPRVGRTIVDAALNRAGTPGIQSRSELHVRPRLRFSERRLGTHACPHDA